MTAAEAQEASGGLDDVKLMENHIDHGLEPGVVTSLSFEEARAAQVIMVSRDREATGLRIVKKPTFDATGHAVPSVLLDTIHTRLRAIEAGQCVISLAVSLSMLCILSSVCSASSL